MRLDSISSLKFVEPAQGAHVVRRKQRRWTRHFKQHSKLKKSARSRFTDTIPNGSQKPCGHAYRLVTLMTTSTSPTRIHLSGMSSEKPCAMMSLEISEMKSSFIAISFCKTRCLPTAGFVLHPPKSLSSGPHQGVMRLDSSSLLKLVESAQRHMGEEETTTKLITSLATLKTYQHRLLRSVWIVRMASQISSFFSGMKF